MAAICLAILAINFLPLVDGHAFLSEPPSRNIIAYTQKTEFCPHCLQSGGPNTVKARGGKGWATWPTKDTPESHGLCGDPVQGKAVEENWRDETYLKPTEVQRIYTAGQVVEFHIGVSTHHKGHYEFRICDKALSGDTIASREEGQRCLDTWVLERAPPRDNCVKNDPDADCQPIDPDQPHRWFLPPRNSNTQEAGEDWSDVDAPSHPSQGELHRMRYIIPAGLKCTHCTLQWYWSTGNTCLYDAGYFSYFKKMRAADWTTTSWCSACTDDATCENKCCGTASEKFAEEFWNCADIAVYQPGEEPPSTTQAPSPSGGGSGPCSPVWAKCGGQGWSGPTCCEPGTYCFQESDYYHQCRPGTGPEPSPTPVGTEPPVTAPPNTPTPQVPSPTPSPEPSVPPSPHACLGLCNRERQTSCSALSLSEDACEEGYMLDGSIAIPCLWTDCGCIADGDHLLECPELAATCADSPTPAPTPTGGIDDCESFCQKENLNMRFQNWTFGPQNEESFCYYYKHHWDLCEASYLQAEGYLGGLSVPCTWTGDNCVAQQAEALDCSGFSCGTGLLALKRTFQHGSSIVDHAPGLRGSIGAAPQLMEPLSVSGPTLLEMTHEHSRTDFHLEEDEVHTNRQKSSEEL